MGRRAKKCKEARAFLEQLKKLDRLIENKLIEIERWKAVALNITSKLDGERVKGGGGNGQTMADAIARYVDIEREITEDIDRLIEIRAEVISTIELLDAYEYDIIHKIYVQYLTMFEVADELDMSYSSVTTAHGRALKNVQAILEKRSEKG